MLLKYYYISSGNDVELISQPLNMWIDGTGRATCRRGFLWVVYYNPKCTLNLFNIKLNILTGTFTIVESKPV